MCLRHTTEANVQFRDPAESTYLRYFYRKWRPTWFGHLWAQSWAWMSALGLLPPLLTTLQVKDRRNGKLRLNVLAVGTYEGNNYLVSMLGPQSEWVQNVRASGGEAFLKRGSARAVTLKEIPAGERAPILKAWCQTATSGRRHLPVPYDAPVSAFEAIAADYPVFRIEYSDGESSA